MDDFLTRLQILTLNVLALGFIMGNMTFLVLTFPLWVVVWLFTGFDPVNTIMDVETEIDALITAEKQNLKKS